MPLVRRSSLGLSLAALAGLVAVVAASLALAPSSVGAGEPAGPAGPAIAVSPRQAALDAVIHRLERHLSFLRKSRTELESGRPEPTPVDDVARHRAEVDQRGVREVSRYEAARVKAVAALVEAETSKDAPKIGDAKAALDTLDSKFVDAMKKLEESLLAPPKAATKDDDKAKDGADAPPKKAPKPAGKSSMSGGSSKVETADTVEEDSDEDPADEDLSDEDESV